MAQRITTKKVLSDEVQGEGSYVLLRALPYEMVTKRAGMDPTDMPSVLGFNEEFVAAVVADWNWVNDEGELLPLPARVIDLVVPEFEFLARASGLDAAAKKA